MATRSQSVFDHPSALFKPQSLSTQAFQQGSLEGFSSDCPSFSVILAKLQEQGLFLDKEPIEYGMRQFLDTLTHAPKSILSGSPLELLATPLASENKALDSIAEGGTYPGLLSELSDEIHCYIAMVGDVLTNQLAQKPYEQLVDQENVTEQVHGLQAGKIGCLLNMPLGDVLALLLHDIARPSIDDPLHGHSNHCEEGRAILSPLGCSIDYVGHHAFAKYLLYTFCPSYKDLLSDASRYSLTIQTKVSGWEVHELLDLSSHELAYSIYKLMFMRLIDDMSKVPSMLLKTRLSGGDTDYFDSTHIQNMLSKQMMVCSSQLMLQSSDSLNVVQDMKEKLDAALTLLLRARHYSTNPALYEKYHQIIEPLLAKQAVIGASL